MMSRLTACLRLMRPANMVTAISDVIAGAAIAGSLAVPGIAYNTALGKALTHGGSPSTATSFLLLILSTASLYGGGVVLNDFFDAQLDAIERPERPIPSGMIAKHAAAVLGFALMIAGIIFSFLADVSSEPAILSHGYFSGKGSDYFSVWIAAAIALASIVYDKWAKHYFFWGPLNMGLCRAMNLLLGMSLLSFYPLYVFWPLATVPLIYIAAITMISRGEVHGGKSGTLYVAFLLYVFVCLSIVLASWFNGQLAATLPFAALFSFLIFPSLARAIKQPAGINIGKAVKSGVIALIAMNASWAAAFGDLYLAVMILLLLPLSRLLGKVFAVT